MPIKVQCKSCGVTLSAPDNAVGKRAKCPKCSSPIEIRQPQPEADIFDAESSLLGGLSEDEMTSGAVSTDDRRPCPACGEKIVRDAIKCRYCGEIFDSTIKQQEQKKVKRKKVAAEGEDMSVGDWFVAILCSTIGCIAGIVWMIQGKPKGKKMLLVSLAVQGFWFFIQVMIASTRQM